ncbi:hypothetical protein AAK894_02660 [Lachnospiraceae bacterium 46-61]
MEYILFSCVGGHDPIASCADGAILHICRIYKPKKVILYLSKEMMERQNMDDRYRKSLVLLQQHENFTIEEIKCIEKEELVNVQTFDTFYDEFEQIIDNIQQENPNKKILLNVSSGTPAMKSALEIIATLGKHNVIPVQVKSPNEKENPKQDKPSEYDVELYWETNNDNNTEYKNRTVVVKSNNLLARIKKEIVIKMIDAYNYKAAKEIAEDIKEYLEQDTLNLIHAAYCRSQIDLRGYDKALKNKKYDFMPVKTGDEREIFEYLISLQIKLKQGNLADFIRGITPVVMDLFENCLKNKCNIDLKKYCEKVNKKGAFVYVLRGSILEQTEEGKKIKQILDGAYGTMKDAPYTSDNVIKLFENLSGAEEYELLNKMKKLHDVEQNVRNFAAHEIVSVTEEWLKKRTEMEAREIMELLKSVTIQSGIHVKKEYWDSYNAMNEVIKNSMK